LKFSIMMGDVEGRKPDLGIVEWFRLGEYDHVKRVLYDLQALGITKMRTGISWADWHVEGSEKWFDWLLPELNKCVEILPCFLYTPPSLGEKPKISSPPKDLKAYADFLDVMITRYGDFFHWVELWNEPTM
jgi:CDP-paratose 2-epimerase